VDPATEDTPAAEAPPRTLGQDLAAERERQGLSRSEVAQRLHMSQWQIEALESGDYARLPKGTFLRGFVRNYSKVLGLDSGAMLLRLSELAPTAPRPGIVVPSQNIRFDPLGERLSNPYVKASGVAVAFIALGFAVLYWWFYIRPSPPATPKKEAAVAVATPRNLAAAPLPAPELVVASSAPTVSEPPKASEDPPKPPIEPPKADALRKMEPPKAEAVKKNEPPKVEAAKKPEPPKAEPAKAEPAKAAAPQDPVRVTAAPKPGDRTVKLRFRGESWVEIRDRNGRVLLSKINPRGSEAEVSGRPPFNIVIGNAPDVQMLYDDREFPLEPHTRVAVARFTVE